MAQYRNTRVECRYEHPGACTVTDHRCNRTVSRQKNKLHVLKSIQNTLGGALSLPTSGWWKAFMLADEHSPWPTCHRTSPFAALDQHHGCLCSLHHVLQMTVRLPIRHRLVTGSFNDTTSSGKISLCHRAKNKCEVCLSSCPTCIRGSFCEIKRSKREANNSPLPTSNSFPIHHSFITLPFDAEQP
jgi:hypothetical protein